MAEMPRPAFIVQRCIQYEGKPSMIAAIGEHPARALDPLFTAEQVEELLRQAEVRAVAGAYEDSTLDAFRAAYCK